MGRTARAATAICAGTLALAIGWAALDAYDVLPGAVPSLLTTEPRPVAAAPLPPDPTAPGAVLPEPLDAVLPGVSTDAPAPTSGGVAAALGPLVASPSLGTPSATVVDALTGEVLLDAGAGFTRTPASTAKVLTAAAAVDVLGAATTLPTRVVAGEGADVVLVGGGDVMIGAGGGDPLAVDGRAGLATLAEEVASVLLERGQLAVAVRLDDGAFGAEPTSPGWGPGDVAGGYASPLSPVMVNGGRTRAGAVAPRVADPGLSAAQGLAALLSERGIAVTSPVTRVTALPGAEVLGEVASASIAEMASYALTTSDNVVAEALARLVGVSAGSGAGSTFAGAGAAVVAAIGALGVDVSGAVLADGSGLADGSLLAPVTLTDLLQVMVGSQALSPLLGGLPVASLTGTLAQRFAGDSARAGAGLVRAKTGSLRGVDALAGVVVDADGRLLAFAVLGQGTPSAVAARATLDAIGATLASCGCR